MKTAALRRLALILAAVAAVLTLVTGALLLHALTRPDPAPAAKHRPTPTAPEKETDLPMATPKPTEKSSPETAQPKTDAAVQRALTDFVSTQGGEWDLYYESLETGASASAQSGHAAEPRSVAASLIKLFVMGAVYDAIDRGTLTHDAVYADLKSMITASDNDACNRLVTLLGSGDASAGFAAVNRFARSLGCAQVEMNRLMLQPGTENFVTARDCGAMLRAIYNGVCVSKSASSEMLSLLKGQTVNDRLPAQLPAGVTVAHKTGNLSNLSCGDVGIILTQHGDYILCVISNHSANDGATTAAIATLSRTVYDLTAAQ